MMARFGMFWQKRSNRERWLIGIMVAIAAVLAIWLAIVRPMQRALDEATAMHSEAVQSYGDIISKTALLQQDAGMTSVEPTAALDQLVGTSAGEAGFTLDQISPQGADRIEIVIASARAPALFAWIGTLEQLHVRVETMRISPVADNAVAMRAVLVGFADQRRTR